MISERWEYHSEWLDYIKSNHSGNGRVQLVDDDSEERRLFQELATEAFQRYDIPTKRIKTYLSIQTPKAGEGYASQFPHIHYPLDGHSLIHYLQPGDVPAPLDVFDGDEEYGDVVETIYPEEGLTVFMPHTTWHGVRKNNGTTDRIQFIATALR